MDEMTLTLNSPITEEQWDAITDVDFEHTNEITFHTKHGKEVKFVKASAQPEPYTEKAGRMTNTRAIDLLKDLEQGLDDYCELNDEGKAAFRMAITALELFGNSEQMPSAQPEIIYCKDCVKHNKGHGRYLDGTFIGIKDCCPLVEIRGMAQGHEFDYQYCVYAERRTDGV